MRNDCCLESVLAAITLQSEKLAMAVYTAHDEKIEVGHEKQK